jgi:hypothetical protein
MAQNITRDSGYVGQRKRDGKWFARLTWTEETTGKRIDRTKLGRDKAHAERLLSQLIAESNGEALESPLSAFSEPGQAAYTDFQIACAVIQRS